MKTMKWALWPLIKIETHIQAQSNILTCSYSLLQNRNSQVFSSEGNADAGPKQELQNSTMIVSVSNNTNGHKKNGPPTELEPEKLRFLVRMQWYQSWKLLIFEQKSTKKTFVRRKKSFRWKLVQIFRSPLLSRHNNVILCRPITRLNVMLCRPIATLKKQSVCKQIVFQLYLSS